MIKHQKFWLFILSVGLATFLAYVGKLDQVYATVLTVAYGSFVTGNVTSKKVRQQGSPS